MKPHLPQWATAEECAAYLTNMSGEQWPLTRLLEVMLMPYIWIDYADDAPAELFQGRKEGFRAPIIFAGDVQRVQHTRAVGLTMTRRPDGKIVAFSKIIEFDLSDLRFSREDVERVAAHLKGVEATDKQASAGIEFAGLFDAVSVAALETMFPDGGQWAKYAERADRNGLKASREGRAKFNPYRAAEWWWSRKNPEGWTWERCLRKLANNLPDRSRDSKHLITGDFD